MDLPRRNRRVTAAAETVLANQGLPSRRSESTGRPAGSAEWIAELEKATGRNLQPRKPGRKPKAALAANDAAK